MNELINEQREKIAHLERINDGLMSAIEKMELAAVELGYNNSMSCSELDYLIETARAVAMVNQKNFELTSKIEMLKGIKPELPPRPPQGDGLPRFGIKWNGERQPISTPMDDGYWTPYHLAMAQNAELVAHNLTLVERMGALEQKNFELTCFNVDVLRCLKTVAFEHNWPEISKYKNLAKNCMESIQSSNEIRLVQAEAVKKAATYLSESIPDKSHESVIFKDGHIYISTRYLREYAESIKQGGTE